MLTPKIRKPAFQFYPQDFLVGTSDMDAAEVGAYIRLLCYQWEKEGLPNDIKKLSFMGGHDNMTNVIKKFIKCDDGLLRNAKLEKVRQEQKEYFQKKADSGKLGGEAKHLNKTKKS
jgi:uncharacterized protein YdaU (DUF1376 family)